MNKTSEKPRSSSMEVSCFLLGLGAGVALTMLYAPMSGKATRKLLERRAKAGQEWVEEQASAAEEFVTSHAEDLRDRVKNVAHAAGMR